MVIKLNIEDRNRVLELLKNEGIDFKEYPTSFEGFLADELKSCEEAMDGILDKYTLGRISYEVERFILNEEIDFIADVYSDIASEYITILDAQPIAIYPVSNNISIQLKDLVDDTFYCTVGNEIHIGETVIDEEDNECVSIGDMLIPLGEFIRVQQEPMAI